MKPGPAHRPLACALCASLLASAAQPLLAAEIPTLPPVEMPVTAPPAAPAAEVITPMTSPDAAAPAASPSAAPAADAQLRQAATSAAPEAAGRLFDGGAKAPAEADESLDRYAGVLENGVLSPEDVPLAFDLIRTVSPVFGKLLVDEVRGRGIPIAVVDDGFSHAEKTLHALINRRSAWASAIRLRRGAPVLEVIHELAHAVPLRDIPGALGEIRDVEIDPKADVKEIERKVVALAELEEGVAFGAEILLAHDLEAAGVAVDYETIFPAARAIFESGGVSMLGQYVPVHFPYYKTYFESLAARTAPALKQGGDLLATPWADRLDAMGVETGRDRFGASKVSIDVAKTRRAAASALARGRLGEVVRGALDKVGGLLAKWRALPAKEGQAPPSVPALSFPPIHRSASPEQRRRLAEGPQTVDRVLIAARFLDFLRRADESHKGEIEKTFSVAATAATRLEGAPAARLWARLDAAARAKLQEKPDQLETLGFALLDAGDAAQGRVTLDAYVDAAKDKLYAVGDYGSPLGALLLKTAQAGHLSLVRRLDTLAREKLGRFEHGYRQNALQGYLDYYGKLTDEGKRVLDSELDATPGHLTPEDLRARMQALEERGLYATKEKDNGGYRMSRSYEESHFESLAKLTTLGEKLTEAAGEIEAADAGLAAELRRTASLADGMAMTGAIGMLDRVIEKWSEEFHVAYDGDLLEFVRAIEKSPGTNKDYDFARQVADKASSVGWALNRRGDALASSLPFFQALPDAEYKVDLLAGAVEKAKDSAPASLVLRAAREWQRLLEVVGPRRDARGSGGSFDRPADRQRRKLQSLGKRLRTASASLGIPLDAGAALREFLTRYGDDKLRRQLPMMSEQDMAQVLRQFDKDEAKFDQLLGLIDQLPEAGTRVALLEKSLYALPGSDYMAGREIPPRALARYLAAVDKELSRLAAEQGRPAPPPLQAEPPSSDWRDSFFYREQQTRWALALIKRSDRRLRALGRRALLDLDGGPAPIGSPRQLISNRGPLFGRDAGGGSVYTYEEYRPAELKLAALLDAAEADWEGRADYLAQAQALAPVVVVDATDSQSWAMAQQNLRSLMRLVELLARDGRLDEAESLFQRVQQRLHALSVAFRARLEQAGKDDYDSKHNVGDLDFWTQDLDSRQSALVARWAWGVDEARARRRVASLLEAFEKDLSLRRDRFDARSMIAAASALEEIPALRPQARRIYELATEKVALLRGNKDVFGAASDYLIDRIDKGQMDPVVKDALLAQAIRVVVPPKGKRGFLEISETMPGLFDLAKRLIEEKRYPEAEKEMLPVLVDVASDVVFDPKDWKNDAKLAGLAKLFDTVLKADPEIAMAESFSSLAPLSGDGRYQEGLTLLLPEEWKAARQAAGGKLSREAIRSGLVDLDEARQATLAEVDAALKSGDAAALRAALSLYREVLDRELNLHLAAHDNVAPSLAELGAIPSVAALESRLDAGGPEALAETLLGGADAGPARARYSLYKDLLGRDDVSLSRRRLAFEGLVNADGISAYAESFFRHDVLSGTVDEARFYGWVRKLLDLNADHLPPDEVLAYLFQNPGEEARFFEVFARSREKKLLWRALSGLDYSHPDHDALDEYKRMDPATFEKRRAALLVKYDAWIPDLFDELELLIAHEVGIHWTSSFRKALDGLRAWYIDGVFDLQDRKKRYSLAKLEEWLAKIAPQVKLSDPQRVYLGGLLKTEGNLSLAQLQTYLGLEFSSEQGQRLMEFMHGERDFGDWSTVVTWGAKPLSEEDRRRLETTLTRAGAAHAARAEKMREDTIEVPEAFQKSIPLVRQALIAYFRQLAFGEREAVLADFDAKGLTEAQAIKRFFEVTGNEKLGQFLSVRRDLVPEEYRRELESFQENVQASSFDEVRATVENELGRPLEQVFAWVSPKPLKVGTIGEVYEVRLHDGSRGVVKVITPSRRKSIRRNLKRLKAAAEEVDRNAHRFERKVDASRLYAEFERTINEELDLKLERENALELAKTLPVGVTVPAMPQALNTTSILVQSFAEGKNPLELPPAERKAALKKLSNVFLEQVLGHEIYHDDLHPGNIRVAADGTIILLDFGRVGRLTQPQRAQLLPLLSAVTAKDPNALVARLKAMGQADANLDEMALAYDLTRIMQQRLSATAMTSAIFFEAGRHGLEIDSAYLQLVKGIMTFEGTAHELDPDYDLEAAVRAKALARLDDIVRRFGLSYDLKKYTQF